jgi:excisionase family DNA binding protein
MSIVVGLHAPVSVRDGAGHLIPAGERPVGKPWGVAEAADFLGVSVRSLWRLIDVQAVRVARLGRRVLVPDTEVRRLAGEVG